MTATIDIEPGKGSAGGPARGDERPPTRQRKTRSGKPLRPSWLATRSLADLVPEALVALREGYSPAMFRDDAFAGLTVAILAIPLSMAIAIGSGADPGQGLITSIVAGLLISAIGGTRYQIGGPAAAFIVIIAGIVAKFGMAGMMTATLLAGVILVIAALARVGSYISYVPGPVILGFTSAIGVLITIGQLKDFFGLSGDVPADVLPRLKALWSLKGTASPAAIAVGAATVAMVIGFRKAAPKLPGLLAAVVIASLATWALGLPVETIGKKFGTTVSSLPAPHLPDLSFSRISEVLPTAFTLAFLIGVESLLSAVAADAIAGTRHRSNAEILGQGIANIASPLFSGLPATGVIARTGTNIAAGAKTPIAGVMHALIVLLSVLLLGKLTAYLPLPCLAAVLLTVAWRLIDFREVVSFARRAPRDDVFVLAVTWLLTVFDDLNTAIAVGVVLAAILLMHRMAEATGAAPTDTALSRAGEERRALANPDDQRASPWRDPLPAGVKLLNFHGPMFFGQSNRMADVLKGIGDDSKVLILRMREVPLIDSTAIITLEEVAEDCSKRGCRVIMSSLQPQVRTALHRFGFLKKNRILIVDDGFAALAKARALLARA